MQYDLVTCWSHGRQWVFQEPFLSLLNLEYSGVRTAWSSSQSWSCRGRQMSAPVYFLRTTELSVIQATVGATCRHGSARVRWTCVGTLLATEGAGTQILAFSSQVRALSTIPDLAQGWARESSERQYSQHLRVDARARLLVLPSTLSSESVIGSLWLLSSIPWYRWTATCLSIHWSCF